MNLLRNVVLTGLLFVAPVSFAAEEVLPTPTTTETPATPAAKVSFFAKAWDTTKAYNPASGFKNWFGAARVAKWLATPKLDKDNNPVDATGFKKFVTTYQNGIANTLALVEFAVIAAAAYKAYTMICPAQIDADEDMDIFADEDDLDEDDSDEDDNKKNFSA